MSDTVEFIAVVLLLILAVIALMLFVSTELAVRRSLVKSAVKK